MVFFLIFSSSISNLYAENENIIYGHIYDSYDMKPISDVEINYGEIITFSDSSGLFSIKGISETNIKINFIHPYYIPKSININFTKDSILKLDVNLNRKIFQTPIITVTDEYKIKSFSDYIELTNMLEGKELERNSGLTLANTLKNETGISLRSMGPAPSRPVFRGLSGDRIFISEDGRKTIDLSGTSPDHSIALEGFTATRIEVLRGPITLTKTSNTMGGIINTIRNDIPFNIQSGLSFLTGLYYETANNGYSGLIKIENPISKEINLYLEASKRQASDLETPTGVLSNSALKNYNYSIGTSYTKNNFLTGFNFREFDSDYGIPGGFTGAHPNGVNIKLNKKQFAGELKIQNVNSNFRNTKLNYSFNEFTQTEYEDNNIIGADFRISEHSINLESDKIKFFNSDKSKSGIGFDYRTFNIGGFVFTPPVKSYKLFLYEYFQKEFGKLILETSGRFEYNLLKPDNDIRFIYDTNIQKKNFSIFSFSLAGLYNLNDNSFFAINLSKTSKSPSIEELYSRGPHLAAYSYETGNINLKSENGIGIEISGFYSNDLLTVSGNLFSNIYSYFITPRNTGDTNYQTLLPIYAYQGEAANFFGFETQLLLNLPYNLIFQNNISYTYGEFKTGSPLPNIPPLKSLWELRYEKDNIIIGINSEICGEQNRVDEFETPTKGYGTVNTFFQMSLFSGKFIHNLSFSADNIFNKEYRNHLSRIKSIVPEAGRNFRLVYKLIY